jgi:hypothetical protein
LYPRLFRKPKMTSPRDQVDAHRSRGVTGPSLSTKQCLETAEKGTRVHYRKEFFSALRDENLTASAIAYFVEEIDAVGLEVRSKMDVDSVRDYNKVKKDTITQLYHKMGWPTHLTATKNRITVDLTAKAVSGDAVASIVVKMLTRQNES